MPIYEYGCEAGHRFEVKQKVNDPPLTKCQVCARPASKLISASALSFKGTGWYVTDYSNKLKPPAKEGQSEGTSSSSSSSSSTSPKGTEGTGSTPTKPSDSSGS